MKPKNFDRIQELIEIRDKYENALNELNFTGNPKYFFKIFDVDWTCRFDSGVTSNDESIKDLAVRLRLDVLALLESEIEKIDAELEGL